MAGWIIKSTASLNIQITDVAFCSAYTKWVAVGSKISDGTPIAIESSNGLSWTPLITGFEASTPFRAVRGIDLGVSRGLVVIYAADKIIEKQQNGTWTEVASGITPGITSNRLIYLPGAGFCLMRASLSPDDVINVFISNDGVTWTGPNTVVSISSVGAGGNARALIRFGLHFIILYSHNFSSSNSRVNYSSDGSGWNQASMTGYTNLIGMAFPPGKAILTGRKTADVVNKVFSGSSVYDSWIEISTALNNAGFLEYNSNIDKMILINPDGNSSVSDDGVAWEPKSHPAFTGYTAFTAGYTIVGSNEFLLIMSGSSGGEDNPFSDFTENVAIDPPTNPEITANNPNDRLEVTITFDTNNNPNDIDGYAILRTNPNGVQEFVGSVLNGAAPDSQTFIDSVPSSGIYTYTIFAYSLDDEEVSDSVLDEVSVADIIMVGSGGVDVGGSPSIIFIGEPSGIYTLVKDKTHDTLYERQAGTTTFVNVKIPDPHIKTGFIGGSD